MLAPPVRQFWMDRDGEDEMSVSSYNVLITLVTVYGLVLFSWTGSAMNDLALRHLLNPWHLLLLIAGAVAGVLLSRSNGLSASFGGLTLLAASLGSIVGPVVGQYHSASIAAISLTTIMMTVCLGAAGIVYPKSLKRLGPLLCTTLLALVITELSGLRLQGQSERTLHSISGVVSTLVLSAYVAYDFNRAQYLLRTTTNVIHVGAHVFLDVVTIFTQLLRLIGSKKEA